MKKIFFILFAFLTVVVIAQKFSSGGVIFSISAEGDPIIMAADNSPESRRSLSDAIDEFGDDTVAKCRCYQGADRAQKNKDNGGPTGSCCWVDPATTNYPYCSNGCI